MTRSPILLGLVLALSSPLAASSDLDLEALRVVAIQDRGRLKPLDTFAREWARRVAGPRVLGGDAVRGLDPVEWLVSMLADPERWRHEPVIRVAHGLRRAAGLPGHRDRYSYAELVDHAGLAVVADRVRGRFRNEADPRLDPVEQEASDLADTLSAYAGMLSGTALLVVPHPADPDAAWSAPVDRGAPGLVASLVSALVVGYRHGDHGAASAAGRALQRRLAGLAPGLYPPAAELAREVHYNRLRPFLLSGPVYLAGALALWAPIPGRGWRGAGLALVASGFLLHSYGLVLRSLIAGRPPVSNMYESVVWVAWGAVLLGFVVGRGAWRAVAGSAAFVAALGLVLADAAPGLDAAIDPLVPVLRSQLWLSVHVLTVTLGYAAYVLAAGLAHVPLGLCLFAPRRADAASSQALAVYRCLQVGTLLLAAGTLLGGVWASYSWGRFWGWDPKETWALIALLGYLAVLHGRMAGWFRELGTAVGAILGFLLVLMAWYGVNFVLGTGLHAYGFGSGGVGYVAGFAAVELALVVAVLLRRRNAVSGASAGDGTTPGVV